MKLSSVAALALLSFGLASVPAGAGEGQSGIEVSSASRTGHAVSAQAQTRAIKRPARKRGYGYVDFVARQDAPLGHTYIKYGQYGGRARYAGLYPKYGVAGKGLGTVVPVDSETGRHAEDTDDLTLYSFRVELSRAELAKLHAGVLDAQKNRNYWHALVHNCNDFVGHFARVIGMSAPPVGWMPTPVYISAIRAMNPDR